jgi:oligopeptide/dipeptide ABC transporter ATP-binding protein
MNELLRVRDASVTYPGSSAAALKDVDFDLAAGQALGIVGESGSGKTTLGRALVGTVPLTTGEILVQGKPWSSIARTDSRRRAIQMIFQDPFSSLNPMLTALQTVAEAYRAWNKVSSGEATRRANEILTEVGLHGDVVGRRPRGLSGGQRQRVGIARALACDPSVLVADEPTSALDASAQAQVLNLLLDLRKSRGLALVLISHDLSVIEYLTEEALVVYRGHIVERGPTLSLLSRPRHPYTDALVASIPGSHRAPRFVQTGADPTVGCVFAPRCPHADLACFKNQPRLDAAAEHQVACVHPLEPDQFSLQVPGAAG